jgi:hypothetical protein
MKYLFLSLILFAQPLLAAAPETAPAVSAEKSGNSAWDKTGFEVNAKVGLPYYTDIGVEYYMPNGSWSFGLATGGFSGKTTDVDYKLNQTAVYARWFPWQGSFYVGLMAGTQKTVITAKQTVSGFEAQAELEVKNSFATPNIGWMWISPSGFSWGFEIGAQVQSGATTTLTPNTDAAAILNDPEYIKAAKDATDAGDTFGKSTLPHITLLKIGYVF